LNTQSSPKVSVITACYNHGKYIHEMIDSVLNQSFHDFEIIIVNDGSTDDTRKILDEISHSKIKVIHSEHKGPSYARNLAISEAESSIILNLDADDKIGQKLLEKAYKTFCENPETGIVYSDCEYFGSGYGRMIIGDYSLRNMLAENRIVANAFFRKEDWKRVGGYSEDFIYGLEDWDLWLSIIRLGRSVIKIKDSGVYYRRYEDPYLSRSGNMSFDRLRTLNSLSLIFIRHRDLYSHYPQLYNKFSAYSEMLLNENNFEKWRRNKTYILKRKLSSFIR
jgi:glycosyltransferase involved in cell wall biosynthesis